MRAWMASVICLPATALLVPCSRPVLLVAVIMSPITRPMSYALLRITTSGSMFRRHPARWLAHRRK